MDDNAKRQRYFWIKIKEDFMRGDTIDWLLQQKNGHTYFTLYLILCMEGINTDGRLEKQIGDIYIKYDIPAIAQKVSKYNIDIDTVAVAMNVFMQLKLIYTNENGVFVLSNFRDMVGSETSKAALMRDLRARRKTEALEAGSDSQTPLLENGNNVTHNVTQDIRDKSLDLGLIKINKIDMIARAYSACGCVDFFPNKEFVNNLLDALVEACQFESPRTYGGKQYTAEDFIQIFESLTANDIVYIVNRILPHMKEIDSFDNYAISVIAECYEHRKNNDQGGTGNDR